MTEKTIDRQTYLAALGLYTLARRYYERCREAEAELCAMLGIEGNGHIADQIYGSDGTLDEGLKREGFIIDQESG